MGIPEKRRSLISRLLRWMALAAVVFTVALTVWLLYHLRPRHAHFSTPRGGLESVEVVAHDFPLPGVQSSTIRIRTESNLEVVFRVVRPADGANPLPLMVLLGGHRTGHEAVELVGDPGSLVVAALDYPYEGPDKLRGMREVLRHFGSMQQALLDTPVALSFALDWLIRQPWIDSDRVELVGVSLGAPFVAVAGALDCRFNRVWIMHGGADNREWLDGALRDSIASDPLRAATAGLLHLVAHGASFDTEEWVTRIAPRAVVIVGADQDESLTRDNVERLYRAAGEPRELVWTTGGHVHPARPEIVGQLIHLVQSRLQSEPVPPCR